MAKDTKIIEVSAKDLPLHCPTHEVAFGVPTRVFF